jgi:hypothetical protein
MKTEIVKEEYNTLLKTEIEDCHYTFSIKCVPEEKHEWIKNVIHSHMEELYERTRRNQLKEIKNSLRPLKDLLNI